MSGDSTPFWLVCVFLGCYAGLFALMFSTFRRPK